MSLKKGDWKSPSDCALGEICATEGDAQVRWLAKSVDPFDIGARNGDYQIVLPIQDEPGQAYYVDFKPTQERLWFLRDLVNKAKVIVAEERMRRGEEN